MEEKKDHSNYSLTSLAHSTTGQLDDTLKERLDQAFHPQISNVVLEEIIKIVREYSPIDLAYAASRLPPRMRPVLYENLVDLEGKVLFLINANMGTRAAVFRHISDIEVKQLIEQMPPDDAVSVLEVMPERRFRRLLDLIQPEKAERIREIKQHERNTAGRLMTNEFFAFPMETTIGMVAAAIRDRPGIDLTRQIFVLSREEGELQGSVSERDLIINRHDIPLQQVMRPIIHKVDVDASREEVVDVVERYKLAALPVVNPANDLVGVVTYEDVMEEMEEIADETIAQMAGTGEKIREHEPTWKRMLARAPWLVVTLCAGFLNVGLMSSFQEYAGGILMFVLFFVPLITGFSGTIGMQCSTILVRNMALGEFSPGLQKEAIFREVIIGVLSGLVFGVLSGFLVWGLDLGGSAGNAPVHVGLIVGVGLWGACLTSTLLGVFSPLFFLRIGIDPAIAAGPIVTAANDFLSVLIYFLIALGLNALIL